VALSTIPEGTDFFTAFLKVVDKASIFFERIRVIVIKVANRNYGRYKVYNSSVQSV
jgi:hypothetical protein